MKDLVRIFESHPDIHQTTMYRELMTEIGWQVEGSPGSQIFYRKLGPITIAKVQRPTSIDMKSVTDFRRSHHTFTTYLEPGLKSNSSIRSHGFSVEPFAHSCTSLIDISPSADTIISSFSQKTRYNITRNLKKNQIQVKSTSLADLTPTQLNSFFELHRLWSKQKNVIGYSDSLLNAVLKSFKKSGALHLCYQGSELIGSLLILYHQSVATYYAAFSSPVGYSTFAPTLLTWQAILAAKDHGSTIFDFGGIYDPRYPRMYKKWIGFTKFKEGFRPTVVSYPPTTLQLFW